MKKLLVVMMAVMAIAGLMVVSAFAGPNDKLVVRDSGNTTNLFVVTNQMNSATEGTVGIGIAPLAALHVDGTVRPQFIVSNGAGNARMDFLRGSGTGVSQLLFGTGAAPSQTLDFQMGMFNDSVFQMRVVNQPGKGIAITSPTGRVGIGTTSPAFMLDVSGQVNASGGYSQVSDGRLKEDIKPITSALNKVMSLEGVTYAWKIEENKDRGFPEGKHYGVIAQEVEKVLPEVVRQSAGGEKAVSYNEIVPVLIEAIKDQQKTIMALSKKVNELQKEVTLKKSLALVVE